MSWKEFIDLSNTYLMEVVENNAFAAQVAHGVSSQHTQ